MKKWLFIVLAFVLAAESSFISLGKEVELDVFTAETHRGKNLAAERMTPVTRRTTSDCRGT